MESSSTPEPVRRESGSERTIHDNEGAAPMSEKKETPRAGPKKFSHGFFDPEIAHLRAIVIKSLVGVIVITIIVMWAALTVYWGSLWKGPSYTDKLKVLMVSYDSTDASSLGSALQTATALNKAGNITVIGYPQYESPKFTLGWVQEPASNYPSLADVEKAVTGEKYWAALVVNSGATERLLAARQNGDSSYSPTSAITWYYNQGRNEIAAGNYLVPITTKIVQSALAQWNTQSTAAYLSSIQGNATALSALLQAPQTIALGASWTQNNLRLYSAPVVTAVSLVGLIYLVIFSFITVMAWGGVREIIAPYLRTSQLLAVRIIVPLVLYFPLSLLFAMVNLPFKVPFDAKFTEAGGFFLWWIFVYVGMASLGLSLEFFFTLLGPKFVSFSLLPVIIINVSVVTNPTELAPWFYKYGPAMPLYNLNRAIRTILFNTKNELGKNMGILLGWVVLSIVTVTLTTFLFRRNAINAHKKEQGEQEMDNA